MWTRDYMRLAFQMGGRERPAVDCWGLYRLIVGERLGVWLDEFGGVDKPLSIARTMLLTQGPQWAPVTPGEERPFDLVMMRGTVGEGRSARSAGLHVGCVIEPGKMIDIEERTNVMVRAYRNTPHFVAHPTVVNRVTGIFRSVALA